MSTANSNANQKLTGINPLAYTGVEATTPPQLILSPVAPTSKNGIGFALGTFWLVTKTTPQQLWVLTHAVGHVFTWEQIFPSGTGLLSTLTGNSGGAVSPDVLGNINVVGTNVIDVAGNPATHTETVSLTNGTDGQVLIGGGVNPLWANITSTGGTVTITNGANSINLEANVGGLIVTNFTSNGVWNKNARTSMVWAVLWNGGGGGGSGRQGASTSAGGGGGGAAGGALLIKVPANYFAAAENVTVGAGGTGGAAQAGANSDGNPGTAGTASRLGNIINTVQGTNFGAGGAAGPAAGGTADNIFITGCDFTTGYQDGGNGGTFNGIGAVANPLITDSFTVGGSGGGGSGANNGAEQLAGFGADITSYDGATVLVAGGAAGLESITINGGPGLAGLVTGGVFCGGSGGGGGGGQSVGLVAGNGGAGGIPGGGGGGGGGSLNGTPSGAGGNGARGQVTVIEFLV